MALSSVDVLWDGSEGQIHCGLLSKTHFQTRLSMLAEQLHAKLLTTKG